jgi:hypothetical protein
VALTAVQLVVLAVTAARFPRAAGTGGLFLGFVVTVVWLLTVYWLVMGAWRRSVWGCPFDHDAGATDDRRCVRHPTARP